MPKPSRLLRIMFLFSISVIFILSGCTSKGNSTSEGNYGEILTNIYHNGEFVFEDLSWLVSKQEVMKQKQLSDKATDHGDFIKVEDAFPFNKSSLKQTIIYRFSNDQFISGEYLFSTSDKDTFIEFNTQFKTHLSQSLPEPFTNDLSSLDPSEDISQGSTVQWKGSNNSYLRINLLSAQQNSETEYFLQIKSSAPLPDSQGLAP